MKVVCSRCWDVLPEGSTFCPRCLPPPAARSKMPLAMALIAMCALLWVSGALLYKRALTGSRTANQVANQVIVQKLQTGDLSTPEAFQAHCRKPDRIERNGENTVLHYEPGDIHISFKPGDPVHFSTISISGSSLELGPSLESTVAMLHCGEDE